MLIGKHTDRYRLAKTIHNVTYDDVVRNRMLNDKWENVKAEVWLSTS